MNLEAKKVLIVGAGRSGLAAVKRLKALGARVKLTDRQEPDKLKGVYEVGLTEGQLILGRIPEWDEVQSEIVVLSPGVSPALPFIQVGISQGAQIWSEVELALRDHPAFKIGVTGTNGKTTTTTLIGELAKKTGRPTIVAGNIGVALSDQVDELNDRGIVVAELSSFQLEHIDSLHMNVGILLNVTPDHLDRHGTIENYLAAKARIFENQRAEDCAILNWDDTRVRELASHLKGRVIFFSPTSFLENGYSVQGDELVSAEKGKITPIMNRRELLLRGNHNLENILASIAAVRELGLSWEQIVQGLQEFKGVEHRQEVVGTYEGILYINDSKGTNPDAAEKALYAFAEPIVLIAGGKNKGLDFHDFMKIVKEQVKSLVLVGAAADEMEIAAQDVGIQRYLRARTFEEAVELAIAEAKSGDVVLLSPACTSWDMFKSYEERGEFFKELVRRHYREPIF
ncbi:UDP-N-acetylmuramoylalanine--D-glutamate ligase [Desulfitobacterium dichloroeliminans LMG P-21439]|uniref:UDP-N-acetylmuramoylalanine--D-glutamate ligase n=1 Tax=Desulfitobacterium dichloroeliminans (strain LMG P-21439 / DCA1) TaxID=871963 RepID=L0FB23_DESDL|nr:UDP-N-acetylmuramoyl-L-alanine--D-glutamate ligase [Desulfitobacterium dichloroeliminans]AGA70220.1 UDP-N-acetylmuramoylalanine--D-glutamate ligase [Desulfitobacterium dichloroeliminans LMG P-21439]